MLSTYTVFILILLFSELLGINYSLHDSGTTINHSILLSSLDYSISIISFSIFWFPLMFHHKFTVISRTNRILISFSIQSSATGLVSDISSVADLCEFVSSSAWPLPFDALGWCLSLSPSVLSLSSFPRLRFCVLLVTSYRWKERSACRFAWKNGSGLLVRSLSLLCCLWVSVSSSRASTSEPNSMH